MYNKSILAIFVVCIGFVATSFSQQSLKIGQTAPAFSGTTMKGEAVDLGKLSGRVVVMTFWSTRCLICHNEIPKLNAMTRRFPADKVTFLALSMENEQKIAAYLTKNFFDFQIVPNSFATVLQYADRDRGGSLDMGFPAFFVIDTNGIIQHRSSGYDKAGSIETVVNKLIAK
jgi:peroxiredoxin